MTHELKIWPQYFEAVKDGRKTYEIRKNDRGFQFGDYVTLAEWDPNERLTPGPQNFISDGAKGFTGRKLGFRIGYILPIDAERVVFSLLPLDEPSSEGES